MDAVRVPSSLVEVWPQEGDFFVLSESFVPDTVQKCVWCEGPDRRESRLEEYDAFDD